MTTNKARRNRRTGYLAVALTTLLAPAGKIITTAVAAAVLVGTLVSSADKPQSKKPIAPKGLHGTLRPVLQATEAHHDTTHIETGHGAMQVVLNEDGFPGSDTDGNLGDDGSGDTPLAALDLGSASGPPSRASNPGYSRGGLGGGGSGNPGSGVPGSSIPGSGGPGSGVPGAGGPGADVPDAGGPSSGGPSSGGGSPDYGGPVKGPAGNELPREDELLRTTGLDDAPGISARVAVIPEPSSWALLFIGLLGLTWALRKKTS